MARVQTSSHWFMPLSQTHFENFHPFQQEMCGVPVRQYDCQSHRTKILKRDWHHRGQSSGAKKICLHGGNWNVELSKHYSTTALSNSVQIHYHSNHLCHFCYAISPPLLEQRPSSPYTVLCCPRKAWIVCIAVLNTLLQKAYNTTIYCRACTHLNEISETETLYKKVHFTVIYWTFLSGIIILPARVSLSAWLYQHVHWVLKSITGVMTKSAGSPWRVKDGPQSYIQLGNINRQQET